LRGVTGKAGEEFLYDTLK